MFYVVADVRVRLPFVFQQIDSNPTAIRYLTPALIKLYVDIETTGSMCLPFHCTSHASKC
jgi:hypothetical protein